MRRRAPPSPPPTPESVIARQVAAFLTIALPTDVQWTHIPHGGARSKAAAGRLRAEGVRKGAPDLLIVVPNLGIAFVELKNSAGRLSREQRGWGQAIEATPGAFFFVCRSVEEVEEALLSIGVRFRATMRPTQRPNG